MLALVYDIAHAGRVSKLNYQVFGLVLVPHTTPLSVTFAPPSLKTFPPTVAEVSCISVDILVDKVRAVI